MARAEYRVKRIHAPRSDEDGTRVLVDRLWPRGMAKEAAGVDHWLRDVAPSDELRRWFDHRSERWDEFRRRYFAELDQAPDAGAFAQLRALRGRVTLLFAARDEAHNNAVALKEYLERDRA